MNPQFRIDFCPHCGNQTKQELVHIQVHQETIYIDFTGDREDWPCETFVCVCNICKNILLYWSVGERIPDNFSGADLIWPLYELSQSVPEPIARIYKEAVRIKTIAPNAFAVQIRRALEALCTDRGFSTGPLWQRLTSLADSGAIPLKLTEAFDVMRRLGNVGAHADNEVVHPLQAQHLDDFFNIIVEYVYVIPQKLQALTESADKYSVKFKATRQILYWFETNPDKYKQAIKGVCRWEYSPNEVDFREFEIWTIQSIKADKEHEQVINFSEVDWSEVFVTLFL